MSARSSSHPALLEGQAELAALREQAVRTRREAAATVAALAGKVAHQERQWARRAALIGPPAGLAIMLALILYRRHRA